MQKQRMTRAMMNAITMASMFSLHQTPNDSGLFSVRVPPEEAEPLGPLVATSRMPRSMAGGR